MMKKCGRKKDEGLKIGKKENGGVSKREGGGATNN
jgi:hypothetical protein